MANPPNNLLVNLVYESSSLKQVELQLTCATNSSVSMCIGSYYLTLIHILPLLSGSFHDGQVQGYVVRICTPYEKCTEMQVLAKQWYLVLDVSNTVVPSSYPLGVSSLNQGGRGPEKLLNQTTGKGCVQ